MVLVVFIYPTQSPIHGNFMATSRITLRKDYINSGGECNVVIRVYINNKQINLSTPFNVTPRSEFFTIESLLKKKYINKLHEIKLPKQFNEDLIQYKAKVDLVVKALLKELEIENINASLIKLALNEPLDKLLIGNVTAKDTFEEGLFIDLYSNWAGNIKNNSKYVSTVDYLKKFQKQKHKKYKIKEVNQSFFDQFCYWYLDIKKEDGGLYNHSTIRKHIDHIRWCMNYYADDYSLSLSYRKFKFPYKTPETVFNPQALNKFELSILFYYSFVGCHPSFKKLDETRDLFLFSYALGGQRISDLPKLVSADFSEGYISFIQEKTKTFVENPISPIAEEILERNNYKFKMYSDQQINRNLKECISVIIEDPEFDKTAFKELCFDRNVRYITYNGRTSKPTIVYRGLKDDISFKYNRSTFISICASEGWKSEEIAKFTGHKDISMIDYYLKLYDDKLDELSQKIQINSLFINLKKYNKTSDLSDKLDALETKDKRKVKRELKSFIDKKSKEFRPIRVASSHEDIIRFAKEDLEPIFKKQTYFEKKLKKGKD